MTNKKITEKDVINAFTDFDSGFSVVFNAWVGNHFLAVVGVDGGPTQLYAVPRNKLKALVKRCKEIDEEDDGEITKYIEYLDTFCIGDLDDYM